MCQNLLFCLSLMTLMSFGFISCSSDDESSNNVPSENRRKLSELTLKFDFPDDIKDVAPVIEHKYNMTYDSKGRLTIIEIDKIKKSKSFDRLIELRLIETVDIDYDFNLITVSDYYEDGYTEKMSVSFKLDENGYVSRIGEYKCYYDDGYLTRVSQEGINWSFAYNESDLVKMTLKSLFSDPQIYYIFYGNDFNSGTLIFNVQTPKELYQYYHIDYMGYDISSVSFFIKDYFVLAIIAYQAGLFGRTAKHTSYLSVPSTKKADIKVIEEKNPEKYVTTECSFTYE